MEALFSAEQDLGVILSAHLPQLHAESVCSLRPGGCVRAQPGHRRRALSRCFTLAFRPGEKAIFLGLSCGDNL